jgi:hypothetical protein
LGQWSVGGRYNPKCIAKLMAMNHSQPPISFPMAGKWHNHKKPKGESSYRQNKVSYLLGARLSRGKVARVKSWATIYDSLRYQIFSKGTLTCR